MRSSTRAPRVSAEELTLFSRELASMHQAGISIVRAIDFYSKAGSTPLCGVAATISRQMQEGRSLSSSLRQFPTVFSDVYVSLIEAGESSGEMRNILDKLADLQERNRKLRQQISATLTYPLVLLVACLVSLGFFIFVVLPAILPLFDSMHLQLPFITGLMANLGALLRQPVSWVFIAALGAAAWEGTRRARRLLAQRPPLRRKFESFVLRIPVAGPTMEKIAVTRMLYTFATLLEAGVFLETALLKAGQVTGNSLYIDRMQRAVDDIHQGARMADALSEHAVFPRAALQMVRAAEESGSMVSSLHQTCRLYEDDVEASLLNLSSVLEPAILLGMGVVSAFIILSVILPTVQLLNHL